MPVFSTRSQSQEITKVKPGSSFSDSRAGAFPSDYKCFPWQFLHAGRQAISWLELGMERGSIGTAIFMWLSITQTGTLGITFHFPRWSAKSISPSILPEANLNSLLKFWGVREEGNSGLWNDANIPKVPGHCLWTGLSFSHPPWTEGSVLAVKNVS